MVVLSRIRGILQKRTLEVIPHVYQLTVNGANTFLIVEEKLTLIDTAFPRSSAKVTEFIRSIGRSPEEIALIIITHNHLDHIGGLGELRRLTRAKIAAHKADIGVEGQLPYPVVTKNLLRIPPFSALRPSLSIGHGAVDIPLEGGELFEPLGGLEVIHTPGHTPGSISLFSAKNKLLIVGDALDKYYKNVLPPHKTVSNDLVEARDSIKKLARLDFDILCFGHGLPLRGDIHAKVQELAERLNG